MNRVKKIINANDLQITLQTIASDLEARGATCFEDNINISQLVLNEIDQIGWEKLSTVNENLTSLTLIAKDGSGNNHLYDLSIPEKYPFIAPNLQISIPYQIPINWSSNSTLYSITVEVEKVIYKCTDYFQVSIYYIYMSHSGPYYRLLSHQSHQPYII